jgi:fucose permease
MSTPLVASSAKPASNTRVALVAMTAIFFMWGFITELTAC